MLLWSNRFIWLNSLFLFLQYSINIKYFFIYIKNININIINIYIYNYWNIYYIYYYYYLFYLNLPIVLNVHWFVILANCWYLFHNNLNVILDNINLKFDYLINLNSKLSIDFIKKIQLSMQNKYQYSSSKIIINMISHSNWFFIKIQLILFFTLFFIKYLIKKFNNNNLNLLFYQINQNNTIRLKILLWSNNTNIYYYFLINFTLIRYYFTKYYSNFITIILLLIQFNHLIKFFINYYSYYYNYIFKKYYIFIYNNLISNFNYSFIYIQQNYINQFKMINSITKQLFIDKQICYPSSYILNISIKFLLYLFNCNICLKINFSLYTKITRFEYLFLNLIINQLLYYNLYFTSFFFIREFVEIVYWILKIKDFNILHTFIQRILNTLIIWDHKIFFLFLFNMFYIYFYSYFIWLNIIGIRIIIRGKIAVGGNSRRRKLILNINKISIMQLHYKIYSFNKLLNTKTGALGFRVVILYR